MNTLPTPQLPPAPAIRPKRSKTRTVVVGTLLILLGLILLWTCGKSTYHNYHIASKAVEQFHQQLDSGDFEGIYGDTADEFRRASSRDAEIKFFETVHQKMGNSGKMSSKGFHINWQNGVLNVNQVFETEFALGRAQEGFIWVIDHDQPRLQTYRIDAANLR